MRTKKHAPGLVGKLLLGASALLAGEIINESIPNNSRNNTALAQSIRFGVTIPLDVPKLAEAKIYDKWVDSNKDQKTSYSELVKTDKTEFNYHDRVGYAAVFHQCNGHECELRLVAPDGTVVHNYEFIPNIPTWSAWLGRINAGATAKKYGKGNYKFEAFIDGKRKNITYVNFQPVIPD